MKNIVTLLTIAVVALGLQACTVDSAYRGYSDSYSTFDCEDQPRHVPYPVQHQSYHRNTPTHVPYPGQHQTHHRSHHQPATVIGPQYYRMERPVHGRIVNRMDAPIIAPTHNGSSVIIPRSWD
jgi:hypothetical protein